MIIFGSTISETPHGCKKLSYQPFRNKEAKYNVKIICIGARILITSSDKLEWKYDTGTAEVSILKVFKANAQNSN